MNEYWIVLMLFLALLSPAAAFIGLIGYFIVEFLRIEKEKLKR